MSDVGVAGLTWCQTAFAEHPAQWAIAPRRRHYTELTIRCGTRMAGRGGGIVHFGQAEALARHICVSQMESDRGTRFQSCH